MNLNQPQKRLLSQQFIRFMLFFITNFFLLYIFHAIVESFDFLNFVKEQLDKLINWFGVTFLYYEKVERHYFEGWGDTLFYWVQLIYTFYLSLIISIVFFFLFYKKTNFQSFFSISTFVFRLYLAFELINYGLIKIIPPGQFGVINYSTLETKIGTLTPMELLWNFMAYSREYTIIIGSIQLLAGILLLFRKLSILGACLSIIVFTQVVLLNFSYAVPVKYFSTILLLLSFYLILPSAKNLFQLFILNKPSTLIIPSFPYRFRGKNVLLICLKLWLIVYICVDIFYEKEPDNIASNELYGYHKTLYFEKNNESVNPCTYNRYIKGLMFNKYNTLLENKDGRFAYFNSDVNEVDKKLTLTQIVDSSSYILFDYELLGDSMLITKGLILEDSVKIVFKTMTKEDYNLTGTPFQWIFE